MSDDVKLNVWQVIGIVGGLFTALWIIVQDVRNNYLTIREHTEYTTRANESFKRIEDAQRADTANGATQRDIMRIDGLILELQRAAEERRKLYVTRPEILGHIDKDKDVLNNLQQQIDQLRTAIGK